MVAVAEAAVVVEVVVAVVTNSICKYQTRLLLQFHITGRCNLNCKHCYRTEGNIEPLSFNDIKNVIEQYKTLLEKYNKFHKIKHKGHINITGGEPFIRNDIKDIIKYLGDNHEYFSFGILSNGSFIDDTLIKLLKEAKVSFIQLSIDGDEKTHDFIRCKGDYSRVFDVAKLLQKNHIKVYISFTATKTNYKMFPKVANICYKKHITKLWSDRLVPIGNGKEIENLEITKDIMSDYIKHMKKARGSQIKQLLHPYTDISMNRALQFINSPGEIYLCSAGNSLITVDEFGRIMPCRRMPIYCGNIFSSTLEEVYYNNDTFKELRMNYIPKECTSCKYAHYCRGGAKCQSYAKYGSFHRADPSCMLKKENTNIDNIK